MGAFQIRILPFEDQITCKPGQTMLAAILEHGRYLRYGCKNGGCGTCKIQLLEGEIDQGGSSLALSSSERAQGYALLCSAVPQSDCTVDASAMELTEDEFAAGDRTTAFIAELEHTEILAPDIRRLYLRLVEPESIKFTAGQFVNAAIASITSEEFHGPDNKITRRIHRIVLEKKQPALEALCKVTGLLGTAEAAVASMFHILLWHAQSAALNLE